jgi:hypothetical protein
LALPFAAAKTPALESAVGSVGVEDEYAGVLINRLHDSLLEAGFCVDDEVALSMIQEETKAAPMTVVADALERLSLSEPWCPSVALAISKAALAAANAAAAERAYLATAPVGDALGEGPKAPQLKHLVVSAPAGGPGGPNYGK